MRILNRITKTVWISNEIEPEVYGEPFAINAIVSPYTASTIQDFTVDVDYDISIQTTLKQVKGKGITASSWFWVDRGSEVPTIGIDGATHKMAHPVLSTDSQNAIIVLRKQEEYNPLD